MTESTAVIHRQETTERSPSMLIQYAMEQGADIERLERLYALQVKWEADQARKAFVSSMVEFKRNPPEIFKTTHVKFGNTEYDHATIGDVTSITASALAANGISHRWDVKQADGRITVLCVLTHQLGHSEQVELSGSADQSGGKNNIQAVASTITYLQRYSLLAATGLATKDQPDDDGRQGKKLTPEPAISGVRKKQLGDTADEIRALVDAGDDFGAFGLYEPITDNEEKEYIWPLLPSKYRSALKRMAGEKAKLEKSDQKMEAANGESA